MNSTRNQKNAVEYSGFEQGPIRPPSEAKSLLIRVTRNCPWNQCAFCPVYKNTTFSIRPVQHIIQDIDTIHKYVHQLQDIVRSKVSIRPTELIQITKSSECDRVALNATLNWMSAGMESIFLQDANSLVIKPDQLITVLCHLHACFPWVKRITSYARSHTIARIKVEDLVTMAQSGLNRLHIGMESGSDAVLALIHKGVDKKTHILAGQKVKEAGIELSEYIMPGLGGKNLSQEHAIETADALNQINPEYIRLRTLAVPNHVDLAGMIESGTFVKQTDAEIAREIQTLLDNLHDISSWIASDHVLNLFGDLEGKFPENIYPMREKLQEFLNLSPHDQMVYQVGRRIGYFQGLSDMRKEDSMRHIEATCERLGITPENVDTVIADMMKRFI